MPPKKPPKPELAEQARRLQAAMHWTGFTTPAEAIAGITDFGSSTLQSMVYGHRRAKVGELKVIAEVWGVDAQYLQDGGPEPFTGLASPRAAQPGTRHTLSPAERLAEQARAEAQAGPHEQSSKHVRGGGQS